MKSLMRKILCVMLAVIMAISILPANVLALELESVDDIIVDAPGTVEYETAADVLSTKTESMETGVYQKILEVVEKMKEDFPNDVFSVNGKDCYVSGVSHGCYNCYLQSIVEDKLKEKSWVTQKIITAGDYDSWQCNGFAKYAFVKIFGTLQTGTFTGYENIGKGNKSATYSKCKIGDIIFTSNHAMIYLWHDDTGVTVLDANGSGDLKIRFGVKYSYNDGNLSGDVNIRRSNNWDKIDKEYGHSYDKYGYCSHCGKNYEEINKVTSIEGTLSSTGNIYVKPHPYQGESGTYQDKLSAGTYKIVGKIENHYGNTWYKISYGSSKTGWVYPEDHITVDLKNTIVVDLKMNETTIPKGTSVWANDSSKAYNWYGKVSSSNGVSKITSVTFEILKSDGSLSASSNRITKKPNAVSYTVTTSDDTMQFSKLAAGEYILSLTATDENGKTENKKINFVVTDGSSNNIPVTGVILNYASIRMRKGTQDTLVATISPSNATNKAVTWSSSNTSVATVSSSGVVTGVGVGEAVITATTADGGYKATCHIYVSGDVYRVTYDLNGGSANISNVDVEEGTYIVLPEKVPMRPGYNFAGWQESGTEGTDGWVTTKPTSGYYETGYKYYIWGYECDHCRDYGYDYDVDYTFLYSKDKSKVIADAKANPDIYGTYTTSKLRYFYLIESTDKGSSFYPGKSGSNYNYFNADYIAEDGKTGTASIYKTEFYFESKVYKQEATGGGIYQPGDSYRVTKDVTFTAVWEKVEGYNVTFDANGGIGGPSDMVTEGTKFVVPSEIPTRENWFFLYWFDDEDMYEPGETYTINEEKYLRAAWAPNWTPEIKVGNATGKPGETVGVQIYIYNAKEPHNTTVRFDISCDGFTMVKYENAAEIPENGLLTTVYFEIPDDTKAGDYEVNFNLTEYSVLDAYHLTEIVKISNGTITVEEPEKATYTVTYDANGGTGAPAAQTKTEGEALKLSTAKPVRDGYEFLGWATSSTATTAQYQPGDSYTKEANVTLYAVWKEIEEVVLDASLTVSSETITIGKSKTISVKIAGVSDISMIQFALKYDPNVLKVVSASVGELVSDAIINTENEGFIYFAWESLDGISESGALLNIEFTTVDGIEAQETSVEIDRNEEFVFANSKFEDVDIKIENGTIKIMNVLCGDINGDGKINIVDANLVRRYSAKILEFDEKQFIAADVNGDGKVNVVDANFIRRYSAKIIIVFPVEE